MPVCKYCNTNKEEKEFRFFKHRNGFQRFRYCIICEPIAKEAHTTRHAFTCAARYRKKNQSELFLEAERYRRKERYYRKRKEEILSYIKNNYNPDQ